MLRYSWGSMLQRGVGTILGCVGSGLRYEWELDSRVLREVREMQWKVAVVSVLSGMPLLDYGEGVAVVGENR